MHTPDVQVLPHFASWATQVAAYQSLLTRVKAAGYKIIVAHVFVDDMLPQLMEGARLAQIAGPNANGMGWLVNCEIERELVLGRMQANSVVRLTMQGLLAVAYPPVSGAKYTSFLQASC